MCKSSVIIGFVILILVGCGGDSTSPPVYDTQANPYGLPAKACTLLDQVESGQLATFDLITDGFNRLYTEHSELLDNRHWREIIGKLGPRFMTRAEELTAQGVSYYSRAAGFYTLASFAMPDNVEARHQQELFAAWTEGLKELRRQGWQPSELMTLPGAIRVTRHFVSGDSVQVYFAERHLMDEYLRPVVDSLLASEGNGLDSVERIFLDSLDL